MCKGVNTRGGRRKTAREKARLRDQRVLKSLNHDVNSSFLHVFGELL